MPTGSVGPVSDWHQTGSAVQMSPRMKYFPTGRNAFSHRGKDGDTGISPDTVLLLLSTTLAHPELFFFGTPIGGDNTFQEFGFVPQDCIRKIKLQTSSGVPFFNLFLENKYKNIPEQIQCKTQNIHMYVST